MHFRKLMTVFVTLLLFSFSGIRSAEGMSSSTALLDVSKGRTFVPIRFVTEQFGAEVNWNGEDRSILITTEGKAVLLKIGGQKVEVNKVSQPIDAPPFIKDSTTYVPLRFISTILGVEPKWLSETSTVKIELNSKVLTLSTVQYNSKPNSQSNGNAIFQTNKNFKVGAKSIKANIVTIDLTNPSIDLKVGLAKNQVGKVEPLREIAKRNGAIVAINGTFFDAYTAIKEPYGMIIADGKIVHIGKERSVFTFDSQNNITFMIMNPEVKGFTNGSDKWPNNWYSYWINRTPQNNAGASVIIFTPERGPSIGFNYGTNVIVENGIVKEIIADKDVVIPKNGFVINLMGTEVHNLLDRFSLGTPVDFQVENSSVNLETMEGAIGAGPRLITDGNISVNFDLEGFKEEKIRTGSAARSAIGITKDQKLLLVTTTSTIVQLAEIMKQAGGYNAMNLDGGASSGLFYNGNYVTTPGRDISNAILVLKK